ncbi:MAG: hypothetical protein WAW37_04160 [Syntrophobacteraceae bacterium]
MTDSHPIFRSVLYFWGQIFGPVIVGLTVVFVITLFVQHNRLYFSFRKKYPEIAQKEIPHVFNDLHRHPEKVNYFYRKKAIPVLKQDPDLWNLRQQVIILTILALGVPVSFMAIGFILVIISMIYRV